MLKQEKQEALEEVQRVKINLLASLCLDYEEIIKQVDVKRDKKPSEIYFRERQAIAIRLEELQAELSFAYLEFLDGLY